MMSIGNPKSACLHFYTAKTQAALALPFLPCSTLRVEQCFDSGSLYAIGLSKENHIPITNASFDIMFGVDYSLRNWSLKFFEKWRLEDYHEN